jgi:hypothetical protein
VSAYRDNSEPAPTPRTRAEDDAAYWYDLAAEDPVPQHEEGRGPFEPLVSSNEAPGAENSGPSLARDDGTEPPERERARTLEQLRNLYLTAEAIGEQNVDRHFNELLARQRQLISEYFGQDGLPAARPAEPQQGASAAPARPPAGDITPPEGLTVRAVPPRSW